MKKNEEERKVIKNKLNEISGTMKAIKVLELSTVPLRQVLI